MFRITRQALKIKETTLNDVKPIMVKEERRKLIMTKTLATQPKMKITDPNNPYYEHYALIKKQQENNLAMYQDSILWSPRFTPKTFKKLFLIPAICVALLLLYIRYIQSPRRILELKKRWGIKFKELESRGWLKGWAEEDDPVLKFEAWTLSDLDKLEDEGMIGEKQEKLAKKKRKFVTGSKEFVLADFKKN